MVYVRMLTILDDAFTYFIDENNLHLPKNCRTLHGKIEFLDKHQMLQNSKDILNKIRKKRNKFGHDRAMGQLDANEELSWKEVDSSIDIVHNELQNILKIGARPKYSITVERSAFETSNEPGVSGAFRYTLTLTKDGKRKYEQSWSYKLLDD